MNIVRGRDFRPGDESAGVVIVGAGTARRLFDAADPIGQDLRALSMDEQKAARLTVIGVVDDAVVGPGRSNRQPQMFVPAVRSTGHLLLRTRVQADAVIPSIRLTASTTAPDLPVVSVRTLTSVAAEGRRSVMQVLATAMGAGVLALFLSVVGLYAVVAVAVAQRVREIGIRTALGADQHRVVGLFVRRGLKLSLSGLAIGLAISLIAVRLMSLARGNAPAAEFYILAAVVAAIVIASAFFASWIPARRAARVDPLTALRME
jgi:predicted lysophospholipase L1 biosynthesis ABC-type transport system permease subunit